MKRPDDANDDADDSRSFSIPRSHASSIISSQPLEDLGSTEESRQLISDTVREINTTEPPPSSEFALLSESNHAYHLIESYKSSNIYNAVRLKISQSIDDNNSGHNVRFSVWMNSNKENNYYSPLSMVQFFHELVMYQPT